MSPLQAKLLCGVFLLSACPTRGPSSPATEARPPCTPQCRRDHTCHLLDDKLVAGRAPLLDCVGREARRGHLGRAHRCYRALRLIESARWWLQTLTSEDPVLPTVYRVPVETVRSEFLCRLEILARARTPVEVERRYLEMIKAYP
jgi:hypothetical protein